ncbi:MAG: outer membrane lipoprotein carrier protein LolA [Proteobacteria bacterium]|nr:MAG: outer membrane lipoprotein carrier protein LolA [Pseudomonadota bacterium]
MVALAVAVVTPSPAAAPSEVAEGYQRVERFLRGLEGLEADFHQVLHDRAGQTADESSGTLAIRRPNRFRWDYRDPYEQVIVADGARVWLYDADLEQVTVRKLDESLSATPAMLLSGEGNLSDNFTVVETSREAGVEWVRMEPKRADTDFRWVRLGFQGEELRYMQLADKLGQTTTLEFSNFQRNPVIDPARFTFTVPPGADVIGEPRADADAAAPGAGR